MKQRKIRASAVKAILLVLVFLLISATVVLCNWKSPEQSPATEPQTAPESTPETLPKTEEEEKEPVVVAESTVGVVGDILIHNPVHQSARRGNGVYDFTENYAFVGEYLKRYTLSVVNMEGTFGGAESWVEYPSGYPRFNCPESVLDALKGAGADLLLTANNHTNDTGEKGVFRTVEQIRQKGLSYLGTRDTAEESFYQVRDVGGISVGMACFTYASHRADGTKAVNGLPMTRKASEMICTFDPSKLADFYTEAENAIAQMKQQGAEFTVFYMHWGAEYQLKENSSQKQIAQKLCDLGVDVIVGGHPHVVQPFETLTSENGNKTYCLYSTGNFLSNQRREFIENSSGRNGYTEDGISFEFSFRKWSDGRVEISEVDVLPLWVNRQRKEGRWVYEVVPLDLSVSDWSVFALDEKGVKLAKDSYNRTMSRVAPGLNEARSALGLPPVSPTV